jgi:hypothetical protein
MSQESLFDITKLYIYVKSSLKILSIVSISIIIHILSVKIYNYHCVGDGWFSIIHTLLYMQNPQCKLLLDIMKYTSDVYIIFWTILLSSILENYKTIKSKLNNI